MRVNQNKSTAQRVAIDLVPILPGKGGSGGGIWTYASSLLKALDNERPCDIELMCFASRVHALVLPNTRIIRVPSIFSSAVGKVIWTHIVLPLVCLAYQVQVLHKVTPDVPILSWTRCLTTIHDFMSHYYRESRNRFDRTILSRTRTLYFTWSTRNTIHKSDLLLFPSMTIAKEAQRRYNVSPTKIRITYEGVNSSEIPKGQPTRCGGSARILYVSAYYPHKGHINGLQSFSLLVHKFWSNGQLPNLVFRGHIRDRNYYDQLVSVVNSSDLHGLITLAGYDPAASISEIYAEASAFLLLSEYEGFGLPLIEAQAHGLPIVCSDIEVFRELLGTSALYVDPEDRELVAQVLHRVLTDAKFAGLYRVRSVENAARFSWKKTAEATLAAYRAVVDLPALIHTMP